MAVTGICKLDFSCFILMGTFPWWFLYLNCIYSQWPCVSQCQLNSDGVFFNLLTCNYQRHCSFQTLSVDSAQGALSASCAAHLLCAGVWGICDIVTMNFSWARPKGKTDVAVSRLWSPVCDSRKWCCGFGIYCLTDSSVGGIVLFLSSEGAQ